MTTRQVLAELGKITATFLLENGGMANGYDTRVTGTLRRNATGALEVFTPTCRKKTYEDVAKLGRELERRLTEFLIKENVLDSFDFEPRHIEHGAFSLYIVTKIEARVSYPL